MNKGAIIQTQLYRQLKALALFVVIYGVCLGGFIVLQEYVSLPINFDDFSYIFIIFLALSTWILTSSSLKLYTYHSFSRQVIISRMAIVQLIVSIVASLLITAHTWLVKIIPGISKNQLLFKVNNVYFEDLVNNEWIQLFLTGVLMTVAIFCLLQFTTLLLISTFALKKKTIIITVILLLIVVLGIIFSLPYWTNQMIGYSIMILGFLLGTGQSLVPPVVIPTVVLLLLTVLFFFLSRKYVKKIEMFRKSFI